MVDRDGLENRCTERYRGFESLLLRSVSTDNNSNRAGIKSADIRKLTPTTKSMKTTKEPVR